MKKNKFLLLSMTVLFAFSTFTGCDSKKNGTLSLDTNVRENSKVAKEEKTDLVVIRPGHDSEDMDDSVNIAIKDYEEKYGVKVTVKSPGYDKFHEDVDLALTSNEQLDVIFGSQADYPKFAMKGYVQEIDPYVDLDAKYVSKGAIDAFFTYKGKHYLAADSDISPLVLFYNKDMLESEGLDDPLTLYKENKWNFDTFREMCIEVTDDTDDDTKVDRWGFYCWYPWVFLGANKTALCKINEDGKYEYNFDDPAVMTSLEFVQDAYSKNKFRGGDGGDIFESFLNGHNLFVNEYTFQEKERLLKAKEEGTLDFEYGVVPMPYGPNNTEKFNVALGCGYSVSATTKVPYHSGQLISMILKAGMEKAKIQNKEIPKEHQKLYKELTKKIYNDTYFDSAINNGAEFFDYICSGKNIQTEIDKFKSYYQDALDFANSGMDSE